METRSPTAAGDFNGAIPSQSNGYGTGSLPRSGYNNGQSAAQNTSGLSELDSLLQDLQNARYHNGERKGWKILKNSPQYRIIIHMLILDIDVPVNYSTPVSKYNTYNSYATVEERPTVDSLLNELDNAHIYAVPNG